jgi:EpsI family protein
MKWIVALLFLGLDFYGYHFLATEEVEPPRASFSHFPLNFGDWHCPAALPLEKEVENNLGVTDYLVCNYLKENYRADAGAPAPDDRLGIVGLYIGYHASQVRRAGGGVGGSMIHPPAHCLPGSGWDIIGAQLVPLDIPGLPGRPAAVNRLIIAKGEDRQLVYYWYQERGRVIARDWTKILDLFWSRATRHRTDGSLVRFTIPVFRNDQDAADRFFHEFAAYVVPQLPKYIPN